MQTASTLFRKGMSKQNTVTIAPGQQFNIFVTKPVSFGI
jgi:type IV secretion system protein VirB10